MADKKILHKRIGVTDADGSPELPTGERMEYGGPAVNFADTAEVLSVRNSNGDIIPLHTREGVCWGPIVDEVTWLIGVDSDKELVRIPPSDLQTGPFHAIYEERGISPSMTLQ